MFRKTTVLVFSLEFSIAAYFMQMALTFFIELCWIYSSKVPWLKCSLQLEGLLYLEWLRQFNWILRCIALGRSRLPLNKDALHMVIFLWAIAAVQSCTLGILMRSHVTQRCLCSQVVTWLETEALTDWWMVGFLPIGHIVLTLFILILS